MGGRALHAIIRTYAAKTAGELRRMTFDLNTLTFDLEFATIFTPNVPENASELSFVSEIFVPSYHYGIYKDELSIYVSDGSYMYDFEKQTLYWNYDPSYMGNVRNNKIIHELKLQVPRLNSKIKFRWEYAAFAIAIASFILARIL